MTGKKVPYHKGIPFNVTRLAGLTTTIIGAIGGREDEVDTIGIVRGESEMWREMPDAIATQSNFKVNRLRILVGEDRFVGALLMGDQTLSRALHHIIVDKVDISSIRNKILDPRHQAADVVVEFWKELSPEGGKGQYATIKS
jgi:hypothetical protein